ncbi:conserved fungal protein [Diplocarpon rosae]|nr:conserved fungal protein [Diplocarpon rosae]
MGTIKVRDLLTFPDGDNSSDTLINGIHWNLTTLQHWNYTYYSNQTFSNGSLCLLVFDPYTPHLLENGTFLNSTTCYAAINPMGARSKSGLVFAALYALSIVLTLVNLRKHGRLFLPTEKRFRASGRRWPWYWMLVVAGCALVSGVSNVDVDRYYLPELPLLLSNLFWFLMLPTTMCVVWESVRHWGSWQERQLLDHDPFVLKQDDRRSRVEFWLPLLFYLFVFMAGSSSRDMDCYSWPQNFLVAVPRSWTPLELQRDPNQQRRNAAPVATDLRFKSAAFLLLGSWLATVFSLGHSIKHYRLRSRGLVHRGLGAVKYTPTRFLLTLPLSLAMIGYEAACAFDFSISPLKLDTPLSLMYGLGWTPAAAILLVHEVAGYADPNDDRELLRQRRLRGAQMDAEMGITRKPHWWARRSDHASATGNA